MAFAPDYVDRVLSRFVLSRELIRRTAALYDVDVLFVLQPDAVYNYPEALYRLRLPDSYRADRLRRQAFYAKAARWDGVLDLTGLFREWGEGRKAVIDDVHYSPAFGAFLAARVAGAVDLAALLRPRAAPPASTGTGRRPSG
jgi:hypothetical protein